MSSLGAFVGRLLLASLFLMSGALKLSSYDPHSPTGGPVVAYMKPKMDEFLTKVNELGLTGHNQVQLQQVRGPGDWWQQSMRCACHGPVDRPHGL